MSSTKYAFLITSAINTKFGVYTAEERLAQLKATMASVKERAHEADIYVLELSALPLSTEQLKEIQPDCVSILSYGEDALVTSLFNSTDNWDVVKNVTEVYCFRDALRKLYVESGVLKKYDRLFKLSGRYVLNDNFDLDTHTNYKNQNLVIVSENKGSQFPVHFTGIERQYMSRLWSWPSLITEEIINVYEQSLVYMEDRLTNKGYADIEHCLYKFLDSEKVLEVKKIGVEGTIAPTGHAVSD